MLSVFFNYFNHLKTLDSIWKRKGHKASNCMTAVVFGAFFLLFFKTLLSVVLLI